MNQNVIKRMIVEGMIDKYIREIKEDPKRSLRKFVDMGGNATKSPFQKQAFTLIQSILANDNSPYYTLVNNLVNQINPETIKTFGINLGMNSWSYGSKMIRAQEARFGYNIPWSITFHCGDNSSVLGPKQMNTIISQGKEKGIMAYLFLFTGQCSLLSECFNLVQRHTDCSFVFFVPSSVLSTGTISLITKCKNLMVSVNTTNDWVRSTSYLKGQKCLYGVHKTYSNQSEAADILNGKWMQEVANSGTPFAFCFGAEGCPEEVCKAVGLYISKSRMEQKYPAFIVDYYADNLQIDQIISDGPCFMGVLPDGTITMCSNLTEQRTKQNIKDGNLQELLKRHPLIK